MVTWSYIFVGMEESTSGEMAHTFFMLIPGFLVSQTFQKLWASKLKLVTFCFLPEGKLLLLITVFNQEWFLCLWGWRRMKFYFCLRFSAGIKRMKTTFVNFRPSALLISLGLLSCSFTNARCALLASRSARPTGQARYFSSVKAALVYI